MTNDLIKQLKHIKSNFVYASHDSIEEYVGNLQYAVDKLIELLIEKEEEDNKEQSHDQ